MSEKNMIVIFKYEQGSPVCGFGMWIELGLGTSREPCAALACCNWVTKSLAEVQAERAMKGMAHWGLTPAEGDFGRLQARV